MVATPCRSPITLFYEIEEKLIPVYLFCKPSDFKCVLIPISFPYSFPSECWTLQNAQLSFSLPAVRAERLAPPVFSPFFFRFLFLTLFRGLCLCAAFLNLCSHDLLVTVRFVSLAKGTELAFCSLAAPPPLVPSSSLVSFPLERRFLRLRRFDVERRFCGVSSFITFTFSPLLAMVCPELHPLSSCGVFFLSVSFAFSEASPAQVNHGLFYSLTHLEGFLAFDSRFV